jgi:hypothetical protein
MVQNGCGFGWERMREVFLTVITRRMNKLVWLRRVAIEEKSEMVIFGRLVLIVSTLKTFRLFSSKE